MLPLYAYPALGVGLGVTVSGIKQAFTGNAQFARTTTALTIIGVAHAAFFMIASAYGILPASAAFQALCFVAVGIYTKDVKDFQSFVNHALLGAIIGVFFGHYGLVPQVI